MAESKPQKFGIIMLFLVGSACGQTVGHVLHDRVEYRVKIAAECDFNGDHLGGCTAKDCWCWHDNTENSDEPRELTAVPAIPGKHAILPSSSDATFLKSFKETCQSLNLTWRADPPACLHSEYHCADGKRVLLDSADGTEHWCLKIRGALPEESRPMK